MLPILFLLTGALVFAQPGRAQQDSAADLEAVVETSLGTFRFEFAPDKAPKHVAHFLKLARQGDYDGGAFFRMVARGIIQGGDPLLKDPKIPRARWGTGGLNLMAGEYSDLKHERGTVSTVRIPDKPDSDGSQFFVCVSPQPPLDGKYSAFGRVTEGMEVVEKISMAPTDGNAIANEPVRIVRITIEPKKREPFLTAAAGELGRVVRLATTLGAIRIQLQPDWAPEHCRNFLKLAATGWLDGTAFHRLNKGFVVQGGMGDGRTSGATHAADRWVRTLKGEFRADVQHVRGIVSMARGDDPDSADTSFFLMLGAAPHLDGKYSAFGRIIEGMEVLDAFEKEEVDGETPKRRLEIGKAVIE
ncbi:MAG: peptidylprolyl isomerase [Bryobacteraceae bacterium]|nr:peptidylprolyl isomerase [Bryobacteraceae bacterium]